MKEIAKSGLDFFLFFFRFFSRKFSFFFRFFFAKIFGFFSTFFRENFPLFSRRFPRFSALSLAAPSSAAPSAPTPSCPAPSSAARSASASIVPAPVAQPGAFAELIFLSPGLSQSSFSLAETSRSRPFPQALSSPSGKPSQSSFP